MLNKTKYFNKNSPKEFKYNKLEESDKMLRPNDVSVLLVPPASPA